MCYSAKASQKAFTIGIVSSITLWIFSEKLNANQKTQYQGLAIFFAFVSFMQLFDWIFWTHQVRNAENDKINFATTKIAMIFNNLQPIVLAAAMIWLNHKNSKTHFCDSNQVFCKIIGLYLCVTIGYIIYSWQNIDLTVVSAESSPSLFWQWNNLDYSRQFYLLFVAALSIVSYKFVTGHLKWFIIAANIGSFLFSHHKYKNNLSTGRFWCHLAPYFTLFILAWGLLSESQKIKTQITQIR